MRLLLDTNAYTALRLRHGDISERVQESKKVLLSVVVAGELFYSFRNGSRYEENADALREFLTDPNVRVVRLTWRTAELVGRISAGSTQARHSHTDQRHLARGSTAPSRRRGSSPP